MKKRLLIIMVLITMTLGIILNYDLYMNSIAQDDGVIEWNSYSDEYLI